MPCNQKDALQEQGFYLFSSFHAFFSRFRKRIFFPCLFNKLIILLIELMIMIIAQRFLFFLYSFIFDRFHLQQKANKKECFKSVACGCYGIWHNASYAKPGSTGKWNKYGEYRKYRKFFAFFSQKSYLNLFLEMLIFIHQKASYIGTFFIEIHFIKQKN